MVSKQAATLCAFHLLIYLATINNVAGVDTSPTFLPRKNRGGAAWARLFARSNARRITDNDEGTTAATTVAAGTSCRGGETAACLPPPPPPPVGAVYALAKKLPLVGPHHFCLVVRNEEEVRLFVKGAVAIDENIPYTFQADSTFDFQLSHAAVRSLSKHLVAVKAVGYNRTDDQLYIFLQIASVFPLRLTLRRTKQ